MSQLRPAVFSNRALSFLAVKMLSQMQMTIAITRPIAPTFNAATGLMTAHSNAIALYTGKARVYQVSGGQQSQIGDGVIFLRTTSVSIPETLASGVRVDDMVTITASIDDSVEVGTKYRIIDVTMGGIGDPTRKLTCTEWEPNAYHTQT